MQVEVIANYVGMKRMISTSDWKVIDSMLNQLKLERDFGINFAKPLRRHPYLMSICENKRMAMQLFFLPPYSNIPIHDHPKMEVKCKILFGEVEYKSYSILEKSER